MDGDSAAIRFMQLRDLPANPALIRPARPLPGRIGVVGAGTIGPDIAYYLASELPATLVLIDIEPQALARARERLLGYAGKGLQRRKITLQQASSLPDRLITSTDYQSLAGCDWVIEAATEDLSLKRRIFTQIEAVVETGSLITSNTSSIPAHRLFSHLAHPERTTVTHFFAPAFQNPVVEVIDWPSVEAGVIDWLRWIFARSGKVPLVTRDVVCFMLDRIFDNWCNEAGYLLAHANAAQIDTVAVELVRAGPFFVLDLANGNPIITETNTRQAEEEGEHYRPAPVFASVERWRLPARGTAPPSVPDELRRRIRDRLLGILYSQSLDILEREIGRPADLELGARLAFGLRRGPLELMFQAGTAEVDRVLARLATERPGMPRRTQPLDTYVNVLRYLLVDIVGDVCVITLRRPEALNALHEELNDELLSVLSARTVDPAITGFVITGYGPRAFCAGADIGRFPSLLGDAEAASEYARSCSRVLLALDQLNKPVVAALNGMALGGGLELAIRCHGIVAAPGAALQFPEIGLGIVPGIGGIAVPYRRWPQAAELFHRMLRRAEKISVESAAAHGVLEVCARPEHLLPRALGLVRELAGRARPPAAATPHIGPLPPEPTTSSEGVCLSPAVRNILDAAIVAAAAAPSWNAALEVGYAAFGASACTAAAREGIAAFTERRAADFVKTG